MVPFRRPRFLRSLPWLLLAAGLTSQLRAAAPPKTTLVAGGFEQPLLVTAPPGDRERIFVVEQFTARIRIVRGEAVADAPFLDLGPLVHDLDEESTERGLLGLAFHPQYASNGLFFVAYVDNDGNSVVARYQVSADPDIADPESGRTILTVLHPGIGHYGGTLAFGPNDGLLYVATGDGDAVGDLGILAQDPWSLHGKILRLDVDAASPYAIPSGNPFAPDEGLGEVWALGFRNPWRFSFDRATGDLYLGDVGQDRWEEIDFQAASAPDGANFGWPQMEANACFDPPTDCSVEGLTLPIHAYPHYDDCAVTGGHVYRGCAMPDLAGTYFFGDFCTGNSWSFRHRGGEVSELVSRTAQFTPRGADIGMISSFGEDGFGELYVVDYLDGEIFKIVPDQHLGADCNANGAPDGCDIGEGTSLDCNGDLVPDECLPAFTLVGETLQAGRASTTTVTCAPPGGIVAFAWSEVGPGATQTPIGTLGLASPRPLGWARADAHGVARLTRLVPRSRAGQTLWWQALAVPSGQVSNVWSATVAPVPMGP